jgi:hypothetical protein
MGANLSVEDIPNDVINLIVPEIDFREYPLLRLVSRTLTVHPVSVTADLQEKLDSTHDGKLHRRIMALERRAMKDIMYQYMAYPRMALPMADVMKALTSQTCEVISLRIF